VGRQLDRRGLHRIHAMGVEHRGRSLLCLMPMGGGKTTLALGLLAEPDFSLLSDEAPLVDRDGSLHGHPIRLGVKPGDPLAAPEEFLTRIERSRHGPKTLIDARWLGPRICERADPGMLLVGRRVAGNTPRLVPIGRIAAARALWRMGVRAQGVPQLLEYVLRPSPGYGLELARIYASRLRAGARLLRRSRCYALELSEDRSANAALVAREARSLFAADAADGRP
jgi:hypothetical protein